MANVRGLAVDASAVIEAVHLDHDYTHTQTGTHASAFHGAASLYNKALAMTSYARVKVDDSWTSFSYHSDIKLRLLTVHGAKGLQAPIVILADACLDPDAGNVEW